MIRKVLLFILTVLMISLAILVLFGVFTFVNRGNVSIPVLLTKPTPTQPPTPTPTPLPTDLFTASPSAYATDEAVLKLEKDLEKFEKELDAVDLDEFPLRPPILDLKVKY